ncbi:heterokaryon incompatibility protein-domain-containing protein [Collybia nuda]|uniref:Heterokaryon incompatibility protein-domain-containing protein n=1 Tax=Collybia nuda TaxID=64659 RepID=A0A9P5XU20_9AGAR|nr:heterokaryon incompatibility protein-domain-containing protein [Collybia nuda]
MRLLNSRRYKLEYIVENPPPYAILSHTWGEEEVTFRDIADLEGAKNMRGFAKIVGACNLAAKDGFQYIWIDTCCIDKESSAELSEAINSMYHWYKNAGVCYAYLADVSSKGTCEYPRALFGMSRWFSRGWTLQELIAPSKVVFYEADWINIGTKASFQETISIVTGISAGVIVGDVALNDVPVAVRMSWAANRNTTRVEDIAYSLMGLFGINMPLLYGEGRKAFIRLQHEIVKKSDDNSIFAWTVPRVPYRSTITTPYYGPRGILARSPKEFRDSGTVERITTLPQHDNQPENDDVSRHDALPPSTPYSLTNQGLYIELPILENDGETLAFLNCRYAGERGPIVIKLIRPHSQHSGAYVRSALGDDSLVWKKNLWGYRIPPKRSSLYIADDYPSDNSLDDTSSRGGTYLTILLNVNVPNRYGKPHIKSRNGKQVKAINKWEYGEVDSEGEVDSDGEVDSEGEADSEGEVDSEGEADSEGETNSIWRFVNVDPSCPGVLIFEEPTRHERFAVMFGLRQQSVVWCDVLTDVEDKDGQNLTIKDHYNKERQSRDRVSNDLKGGWSINVSSRPTEQWLRRAFIDVEIKKTPRLVNVPQRPVWKVACAIVPPPSKYRFKVYPDGIQCEPLTTTIWARYPDIFMLYMSENSEGMGELTFRRGDKDDYRGQFTLVIKNRRDDGIRFGLNEFKDEKLGMIPSKKSTHVIMDEEGKVMKVIATSRSLTNSGLANYMITITVVE